MAAKAGVKRLNPYWKARPGYGPLDSEKQFSEQRNDPSPDLSGYRIRCIGCPCVILMNIVPFIMVGLMAGSLSGFLGIGGGIVVIPILVYLFGFSQHAAQGTTLAMMIPPIGLLAAWLYWRNGNVNIPVALALCLGFFFGGLIGALLAGVIPNDLLKKIFGAVLGIIALHILFSK